MRLQRPGQNKGHVCQQCSYEKSKRDRRRYIHSVKLRLSEFRDQRIIRRTVHRHKKIKDDEGDQDPCDVYPADPIDRRTENQHSHDREGHCCFFHKGDPSSGRIVTAVGKSRDQRIRDRVENPAYESDQSQNCEKTEDNKPGRYVKDCACLHGFGGRQIESDQPGIDDASQSGPPELADCKDPHFFFG